MVIDLSNVLNVPGASLNVEGEVELLATEFSGMLYKFNTPLIVKGRVENVGNTIELSMNVKGKMQTSCFRCIADIEVDLNVDFTEQLTGDEAIDDGVAPEGKKVELDGIITNNIIMNLESKYLCKEDCKGLCYKCGKNLNIEKCGCSVKEMDPRLAKLSQLLK